MWINLKYLRHRVILIFKKIGKSLWISHETSTLDVIYELLFVVRDNTATLGCLRLKCPRITVVQLRYARWASQSLHQMCFAALISMKKSGLSSLKQWTTATLNAHNCNLGSNKHLQLDYDLIIQQLIKPRTQQVNTKIMCQLSVWRQLIIATMPFYTCINDFVVGN